MSRCSGAGVPLPSYFSALVWKPGDPKLPAKVYIRSPGKPLGSIASHRRSLTVNIAHCRMHACGRKDRTIPPSTMPIVFVFIRTSYSCSQLVTDLHSLYCLNARISGCLNVACYHIPMHPSQRIRQGAISASLMVQSKNLSFRHVTP